ncbi:MAG: ATP-binding protein [Gammaproteobacteria bacterium]
MAYRLFRLQRLQQKVLLAILAIVVVPMLFAAVLVSTWVSSNFENTLERWLSEVARANQNWLSAYQSDALMLGEALSGNELYLNRLKQGRWGSLPPDVQRIAKELGITLIQVYSADRHLLYSSLPVTMNTLWEPDQTQAVLKVSLNNASLLAAVGITPLPHVTAPRYYLVLGSLLNDDFISDLSQLSGMKTRLYYREGKSYFDLFSHPDKPVGIDLPDTVIKRMELDKKPYYSTTANEGRYRGFFSPLVDSSGHVEAVMFTGEERRWTDDLLTSRVFTSLAISLVGIAIGVFIGMFLSRMVLRPIKQLHQGVRQLANQDFHATVPIRSQDELGELAQAFNAMAVRLREARDEEQQMFRKDKLSSLGELSAALAHEIRNPIGVVSTAAAMLENPQSDAGQQADLIRMIREESARVNDLVQDFLQLSRHRQPDFKLIDPVQPLLQALDMVFAGRTDIQVHKRLQHGVTRVKADPGLLQQAWSNILINAQQAMSDGNAQLYVVSEQIDGHVLVSVEDSGPGISAKVLPRLFEPFYTTKDQGTGLGLSIAHALVDANGGRLEALEPQHHGARFGMRFEIRG